MQDKSPLAEPVKGASVLLSSIEKKYGRPVEEWFDLIRSRSEAKHMELVAWLKDQHGLGHGHANALVAYVFAQDKKQTAQK